MLELSELNEIGDARRAQGRIYDLPHVLLCCFLAVAAGADSYRGIARFIEARLVWLQLHTGLRWRQVVGHTGLRAILLGLDQRAAEQALRHHASAAVGAGEPGTTIAIEAAWTRDGDHGLHRSPSVSGGRTHARLQRAPVA